MFALQHQLLLQSLRKNQVQLHRVGQLIPKVYLLVTLVWDKRKYFYYKFVYNKNTEGLIEDFIRHYVPEELYDNVFIMPETPLSNLKEKNNNMEEAAEFCKKIGVRYSPRIHVDIWGLQKGR